MAGTATTFTVLELIVMTKLKLGIIGAVTVASIVIPLTIQHEAQSRLRVENEALQRQLGQIAADNTRLSNALASANHTQSLPGEQLRDLLRLRNTVGMLRQQTNELEQLRREKKQFLSGLDAAEKQLEQTTGDQMMHRVTKLATGVAVKDLGLAVRIYAKTNGQFATNFEQVQDILKAMKRVGIPGMPVKIGWDAFEFAPNAGPVDETMHDTILFRERVPRQTPEGKWLKYYCYADGHSGEEISEDGNFDAWERAHMILPIAR